MLGHQEEEGTYKDTRRVSCVQKRQHALCLSQDVIFKRAKADTSLQSTHKQLHKSQNSMLSNIFTPSVVSLPDAAGHFNPFPTYNFSGSLRPSYPLSPRRKVPDSIRHPDYASHGIPKSEQVSRT